MKDFLWLIPLLPLAGFLLNGLLGKKLGKTFVTVVGPGVVGLSFLLSFVAFFEMLGSPQQTLTLGVYSWIEAGNLSIPFSLVVDRLSGLYILIVTGVGFLIHLYSVGYMSEDTGYYRFFAYLNLFLFFMLVLVLGDSLLTLFVGWEGVGLCSYLLIGFDTHRPAAASAAKKAFVVNRIGDFGFLVASLMIFALFGTLNMAEINAQAAGTLAVGGVAVTTITLLIFLGATGKSAQLPLYVWLPDAMEGPTPVSALIHAATMVTAGLYLLARMSSLFVLAPTTMMVVAIVGAATALFAATIGLAQNDIKKVLAYSTVSQLGYMFLAMGVGAFSAGIFHVMTHAFFKALLFLGSGSVIHALHHEQDMQKMGGLKEKMPITAWTFVIGALAISGFPLIFSGFFSKDEILWQAFASPLGHPVLWMVGAVTAVLTAFYMFRAVGLTFFGESRVDPKLADHVHESPWSMTGPLVVLAVLAVIGGWVGIPHALGGSIIPNGIEHYFDGFFPKIPSGAHHGLGTELGLMGLTTVLALLAMWGAYRLFTRQREMAAGMGEKLAPARSLLANKYYVDEIYNYLIIVPIRWISTWVLWRFFDVWIVDALVNGVAYTTRNIGGALRLTQNGVAVNYVVGMVLGAVGIIWFLVF